MAFKLRTAASGPMIRGTETGQALIWNEDADGWETGTASQPNVYTFATLADLEAAFPAQGGFHILDQTGVYQFVGAGFDLAGAVVSVTAEGAIVQGQGVTQITGANTLGLFRFEGEGQTLQNIRIRNTDATITEDRCGVECSGGLTTLFNCRIEAAGGACGLICSGNADVVSVACEFGQGDIANVRYSSGVGLTLVAPRFTGGAGPAVLLDALTGNTVQISDAQAVDNKTHGVLIDGTVVELGLTNCDWGTTTGAGVARVAGTVGSCSIMGGRLAGVVGVDWPAANMPVRGLMIVGCDVSATTPFDGFDEGDARVNIKACVGAAGLLPETPIVA